MTDVFPYTIIQGTQMEEEPSRELMAQNQAHRPMSTAAILASMGYRVKGYN